MTITHELHDWDFNMTCKFEPKIVRVNGAQKYVFDPYFSIGIIWNPMQSIKTNLTHEYKEADDKGNGKLHISPAWDFDVAFGNLDNQIDETHSLKTPDTIYVRRNFYYALEEANIFAQLCTHKDFCDTVKKTLSTT